MAYNTPESVADYLSRFQMQVTERTKGTFSPMHVKYSLDQLRDMGVYAIRESLADEILNDLSYDEDYAPTDDAKDTIMGAVSAAFEERYGEDFAEVATDFGQDIDDIAGRANPCILSVDTVRAVNEKGYDARCSPSSGRPSFLSAISTRKRFPLTAKRTIWKTAGMGLMVTPRKRMPRKRTIEMHSRL